MGTLSSCLSKFKLDAHEVAILRGATDANHQDGDDKHTAAVRAVKDRIEHWEAERQKVVDQVLAKGGKVQEAKDVGEPVVRSQQERAAEQYAGWKGKPKAAPKMETVGEPVATEADQPAEAGKAIEVGQPLVTAEESSPVAEAGKAIKNDRDASQPAPDGANRGAGESGGVTASTETVDAAVEAPAVDVAAEAPSVIEDFGQKLGGAKKDRVYSLDKTLTDEDIATQPLSKIWPADEIDSIDDPFVAAVVHAARAEVPAKPRVSYKVKRWVEKVKTLRSLAKMIVDGTVSKERFASVMALRSGLDGFAAKVALLEAIDRANWPRIGYVREYPNSYTYAENGDQIPAPNVEVAVDGRHNSFHEASSVADIVERVKGLLGEATQVKQMQFEVRGRGESFAINKKGDKEYRKLKKFTTIKEAFDFIRNHHDELVAAWEAVKDSDNVRKSDVRSDENRPRSAEDWRRGKDVTPEQFFEQFRFRGTEFGNWVSQGKNAKERQGMLNQAYDALMDLAHIVNVPPSAISLNGSLGLSFGSRGSGSASAHFEPNNLVINLTKTRGAGVLAHEWFHALDNYFSRQRGGEIKITPGLNGQNAYREQNYITYRPEPMMVHRSGRSMMTAAELIRRREQNPQSGFYRAEDWMPDTDHPQGVRPEVERAFATLVEALNDSPMAARARKNDQGGDGYWSRIIERGARSFENYVIAKMMQNGYHNDYLANVRSVEDFPRSKERYPYLLPEEVAPIAEAFDNLFSTIETRTDESGNTMLYQPAWTYEDTYLSNASEFNSLPVAERKNDAFAQARRALLGRPDELRIESLGLRGTGLAGSLETARQGTSGVAADAEPTGGNRETARRGVSILADGIAADFARDGITSLIGQAVNSPLDLATAAQVYRDPRLETVRYFFVKDGEVVGQTAVSSRLPGVTQLYAGKTQTERLNHLKEMAAQVKSLEADGVWILHNHPSGDPTPSPADLSSTEKSAREFGERGINVLGHVVINQHRFASISLRDGGASSQVETHDFGEAARYDIANPKKAHELLGQQVFSPADLAKHAKQAQVSPGQVVVIGLSGSGGIRTIAEVTPAQMVGKRGAAILRRLAKQTGSDRLFAYGIPRAHKQMASEAILRGLLADAIIVENGIEQSVAGLTGARKQSGYSFGLPVRGDVVEMTAYHGSPQAEDVEIAGKESRRGNPLTVTAYRGTDGNDRNDGLTYYAEDESVAKTYGPNVTRETLSFENPLDLTDLDTAKRVFAEVVPDADPDVELNPVAVMIGAEYSRTELAKWAKKNGYDGLILPTTKSPDSMEIAGRAFVRFDGKAAPKAGRPPAPFVPDAFDAKEFAAAVDRVAKLESIVRNEKSITLGDTPPVLRALGAKSLPLQIDASLVHNASKPEVRGYDVPVSVIRRLPELLANPIMVFDSKTAPDSLVALVDAVDTSGRHVIAAIHLEARGGQFNAINKITSFYGKDDQKAIQSWIEGGALRYYQKESALNWLRAARLQLPGANTIRERNPNVITDEDVVNQFGGRESRGSGSGLPVSEIQSQITAFRAMFPGADRLDIRAVPSRDQLPAGVRASPRAEGVYLDGRGQVFLIAANLGDANRVWQVLAHEVVGHYGLEGMGEKYTRIKSTVMQKAHAVGRVTGREAPGDLNYATVEAVRLSYPEASNDTIAAEVLARMTEVAKPPSWFKAIVAMVRQWLKTMAGKLGWTLEPSLQDAEDLIQLAAARLRNPIGGGPRGGIKRSGFVTAFSETAGLRQSLTEMWKRYADEPGSFLFGRDPRMLSKDLDTVLAAFSDDQVSLTGFQASPDEIMVASAPNGQTMHMKRRGDGKWVIAASTTNPLGKQGRDGQRMYQALFAYAHNNGLEIAPDSKLTSINALRRTSAMLSSALRFGRSDFFSPHEKQGVEEWSRNHQRNIAALAMAELKLVRARVPGFDQLRMEDGNVIAGVGFAARAGVAEGNSGAVDQGETSSAADKADGRNGRRAGGIDADDVGARNLRRPAGDSENNGGASSGDGSAAGLVRGGGSEAVVTDAELGRYLASLGEGSTGLLGHGVGIATLKRALATRAAIDGLPVSMEAGLLYSTRLFDDLAAQTQWLSDKARLLGYQSIDQMVEKDYAAFERLATEWREDHPQSEAMLSLRPQQDAEQTGLEFAAEFLNELSFEDDAFRFPVSQSLTLSGNLRDAMPGVTYLGEDTRPDERNESKADHRYVFSSPLGTMFYVFTKGKQVWIDVSRFQPGDRGGAVYHGVANWAYNTGRTFVGDPNGLSEDAIIRRTSAMLSSALRFGTTKHIAPAREQLAGVPEKGIEPLEWKDGNDLANVKALLHTFITTQQNLAPWIKDYRYDFANGKFVRVSDDFGPGTLGGRDVRAEALGAMDSKREGGVDAKARAGEATLRRGILIQSLVESQSSERPGLLENVFRRSAQLASREGGLKAVFSQGNGSGSVASWANSKSTTGKIRDYLADLFGKDSAKTFNWYHKTVGTQYHKAQIDKHYGRVFNLAQSFIDDVSRYGTEAADMAPDLLPKMETLAGALRETKNYRRDMQDAEAIAGPIFEGTLYEIDGEIVGKVWDDEELRDQFGLNDRQIGLYRQFRNAVNHSLEQLAISEMRKVAKAYADPKGDVVLTPAPWGLGMHELANFYTEQFNPRLQDAKKALHDLRKEIESSNQTQLENAQVLGKSRIEYYVARQLKDEVDQARVSALEAEIKSLVKLKQAFAGKAATISSLKNAGYAPLMRFGKYTVDVTEQVPVLDADGNDVVDQETGEVMMEEQRHFFGMFDSEREAREAEQIMREEYPNAEVVRGVNSDDGFQLFGAINPGSLEMIAKLVGKEDEVMQRFYKEALSQRSALKRLIHRKGTAGYSKDVARSLASFVISNARASASADHFSDLMEAAEAIPKQKGDVKDEAVRLINYIRDPNEEAGGLRGLLFMQFLGGSVAAAFVNLTQTATTTYPYLHQFGGGLGDIFSAANSAFKWMKTGEAKGLNPELAHALEAAEREGLVAPHNIHALMGQAGAQEFTRHRAWRLASHLWGSMFSMAEQFNRHTAFIAAYSIAQRNGKSGREAYEFAKTAVRETQFVLSKAARPNWARGAVGATLMTFKQFSIFYVELLKRMPRKEQALMLGVLIVLAGVGGAPGADDLDDLIDTLGQALGYNTNSHRWKNDLARKVLGEGGGEFVMRGVSAFIPIEIQSRLGLGNLIPASGALKKSNSGNREREAIEFMGAAGGYFKQLSDAWDYSLQGRFGQAFAQSFAPKAIKDASKAFDMASHGTYDDPRGRLITEVDGLDSLIKALGFQPTRVSNIQREKFVAMQSERLADTVEASIVEIWAQGIHKKDPEKAKRAREMLAEWNRKNPETPIRVQMSQVLARIKNMRKTANERFIKSIAPERRARVAAELNH